MIPKIIHYIWLGDKPKPTLTNICILSWREKLPDYQIIEWNESNLDLDKITMENRFFAECRKRRMWAFMADYLRLKILYENGGIYLDTDMFVLKKLDPFLDNDAFVGKDDPQTISCGIMGFSKGSHILISMIEFYDEQIWHIDMYVNTNIFTYVFKKSETLQNIQIYEQEYFYPLPYGEVFDMNCLTENSFTIHWWALSWRNDVKPYVFLTTKHIQNPIMKFFTSIKKMLGFYRRKWRIAV